MQPINLSDRHVMAIVNVTPDSFYSESRTAEDSEITARVECVINQGATIIDIGGYSSRPNAEEVSLDEEWRRVERGLKCVREVSADIAISIDTFRAEVVRRAAEGYGRLIVNDITAGEADAEMIKTVALLETPYIAMHMRGTPQTMQQLTHYYNVVNEVGNYLKIKADELQQAGVKQIVLDPGFGFAKSLEQNHQLLKGVDQIALLGYPILVGLSRKSMIYKGLDISPAESLPGTTALHWEALRRNANILRVHDVAEAVQVVKLFQIYEKA